MASTADIRNGLCIDYSNDIYVIVEFQHVKPGKGAAFVRTKLKSLTTGRVIDNTFPSGHKIDDVRIERRKFQFLYKDETGYNFMDNESYEQITLEEYMLDRADLMKEGSDIDILFHAAKDMPLTTEMPAHVTLLVTYAEPGVRGDTATNVTKLATLETGANIKVPIFVNEGDKIKIDTRTGDYLERVRD
jgi:elongation factor P